MTQSQFQICLSATSNIQTLLLGCPEHPDHQRAGGVRDPVLVLLLVPGGCHHFHDDQEYSGQYCDIACGGAVLWTRANPISDTTTVFVQVTPCPMITQRAIIHNNNRSRNALSEGLRSQDSSYLSSLLSKLGFDVLCLFGLVSTVTSLRGYWMFLDAFIFPERPVLTVLVPGLVGFVSLMTLKILSSLHGGIVTVPDVQQGILWPSWLLTYWLIKARNVFRI